MDISMRKSIKMKTNDFTLIVNDKGNNVKLDFK